MNLLNKFYYGIKYRAEGIIGTLNRYIIPQPQIMNSLETLDYIYENKLSLARYGDGEFSIFLPGGKKNLGFQKYDPELAKRLETILKEKNDNLLIGLPDVFGSLSLYENNAKRFWKSYLGRFRREMVNQIDINRIYGNTNVTRYYSGYKDKKDSPLKIIKKFRLIWDKKDVIFIEGDKSRLGTGNDLFDNAKSIKRVLCPAENAFSSYDKILKTALKLPKDSLIIIALGPTATVLAGDLSKAGYQALDLGHIDIQYEYYIRQAKGKISIEGKYVNENIYGKDISDDYIDDKYLKQIIYNLNEK